MSMNSYMKTMYINLTPYKSLRANGLLSGREQGMYAKNLLRLDTIDKMIKEDSEMEMEIQFPDDVYCVNDSFLKGLLQDTYKTLGYDTFVARVKFYTKNEHLKKDLDDNMSSFIIMMKRIFEK